MVTTHDEISSDGQLGLAEADPLRHHGSRDVTEELGHALPAHGALRDWEVSRLWQWTVRGDHISPRLTCFCQHWWHAARKVLTKLSWTRGRRWRWRALRRFTVVAASRAISGWYLYRGRLLRQLVVTSWTIKCPVTSHPPVAARVGGHGEDGEREESCAGCQGCQCHTECRAWLGSSQADD